MRSFGRYLFFVMWLALITDGFAQELSLFDVNTDAYPNVKAKFYAFDANAKQIISLTRSDVVVAENGNPQQVVNVTNPEYVLPKALSIVLSVDISGSMTGSNMEMAKQATRTLVQLLQLDRSECAITSFDNSNYINVDFSSDPTRLLKAIDDLEAQGGTDYDEAFNNDLTGALEIARSGSNKKAMIFLTDGLGSVDHTQVIQRAKSFGVTIYSVTINMPAPGVLKEISTQTGGAYFEYIDTPEKAKKAYQRILFELQELKPSTIEWVSTRNCSPLKSVSFQVPSLQLIDNNEFYRVADKLQSKLSVSSDNIKFKGVRPGEVNDTTIMLSSINEDFTILSGTSSNPVFKIVNTNFPMTIKAGQSVPITLQYSSEVRKYEDAAIQINNDRCEPIVIYANNGWKNNSDIPLNIEHPNGGEVFFAGSDTVITWSGVFSSDKIKLELSSDSARSWKAITTDAKSLEYEWHVPNNIGDKMLIRGSVNFGIKNNNLVYRYERGTEKGENYNMSPDNSKLLYRDYDKIVILDFLTGEHLHTIKFDDWAPRSFFGGNGTKICTWPYDAPLEVYDAKDYKHIGQSPKIEEFISFNDEATQYLRQMQSEVQIVELETGQILKRMTIPNGKATSYRDNLVVVIRLSDRIWEVWNIDTQTKVASFDSDQKLMFRGTITGNKKYLIVKSRIPGNGVNNYKITIFDLATKKELYSSTTDVHYNIPDVANNVMLRSMNKISQIIDVATGEVIGTTPNSGPGRSSISRDGKFVMIETPRTGIEMFRVEGNSYGGGKGSDISDNTFSIIAPKLVARPLDFGEVRVGDQKEQIFSTFLKNPQNIDVVVDSIYLDRKDITAFSIVSSQHDLKIKGLKSVYVELSFKPTKIGPHETKIVIITHFEKIEVSLKGEGFERRIAFRDQPINLGKVMVGNTKDSLVSAVIMNTGSSNISISSLKIAGPDYDQFELHSNKGFKLKKNASMDLRIIFEPTLRGKTLTRIQYEVDGDSEVNELEVFAEGVAPRTYLLNGITLDSETEQPIQAEVGLTELNSSNAPRFEHANNGKFHFTLNADRVYALNATKDNYTEARDTIDLRIHQAQEVIDRTLRLKPIEDDVHSDSLRKFNALVLDKITRAPISSRLIRTESTEQNDTGKFSFYTIYDSQIRMIAESDGYLPAVFQLESDPGRTLSEVHHDFLLTMVVTGETVQLDMVLFVQSKAELFPESFEQLDMLLLYLNDNPENKIELAGHTDNQGSASLNLQLSEDRVKAIMDYLIEKGVNKKLISGKGYGETKPIASNAQEETRRLNRRVEFKIVK